VIYSRFSPRRNADKSESCEVQEAYCEEFAAKNGLHVVATMQDKALSGDDEERPGLWGAIQKLQKGWTLLVYRPDRLSRNVYLNEVLKREVGKIGACIKCVAGDMDGDGPEAQLLRQVMAAIAEYERKIIGIRTKNAMLHRQSTGQRMGRFAPYGFTISDDGSNRLVENPAEHPLLGEIASRWNADWNASDIVRWLNKEHRDMARGKRWNLNTVTKIIKRTRKA
jgi:DNA invertase Pin-like site-specific DNA recombinase